MTTQRTLSIIKPDATRRNLTGAINQRFEEAGLRIVAQKRVNLSRAAAEGFYAEHAERPFFGELVDFMISEPVVLQVLEGENAILKNREIMGETNPANAAVQSVKISPYQLVKTLFTVQIQKNQQHVKFHTFSQVQKSQVNF
jgi:nucleoside-diphosphate kinase